jgi:hypothetical protein
MKTFIYFSTIAISLILGLSLVATSNRAERTYVESRSPMHPSPLAKNILIYGPSLDTFAFPNEQHLASAAGHSVTVVDATTWSAMTTAQFAAFDAIVFGDPSCLAVTPAPLSTAVSNKSVWSSAISGPVYVQGTDPVFHRSLIGAQHMITSGINFVANGTGTGLYVSLSCYYDNGSASTPVDLLTALGDFRVSEGQCANTVTIAEPTHPAMTGLTNANLSDWGCSVHDFIVTFPPAFTVLAKAVRPSDDVNVPYIIATSGTGGSTTPSGFFYPINLAISGDANWSACGPDYFTDLRHIGADLFYDSEPHNDSNNIGRPVIAISRGTVIAKSGPSECSGWGIDNFALAIRHSSTTGDFIAVYGHIRTSLNIGDGVDPGEQIGILGAYQEHASFGKDKSNVCKTSGSLLTRKAHLHFGVFPSTNKFPSTSWGRVKDSNCSHPDSTNGFVNPLDWIRVKVPIN